MKRSRILLLMAALLLLATLFVWLFLNSNRDDETLLILIHHWEEPYISALENRIAHFEDMNPQVRVNLQYHPAQQRIEWLSNDELHPDLFLWDGPLSAELDAALYDARLWKGSSWILAANSSILLDSELELLLGEPDLEEFETLLESLKDRGVPALSLGNSHYWTLSVWAQHVLYSLVGPDEDIYPLDRDQWNSHSSSWNILKKWNDRGYFYDESWQQSWAQGVLAMAEGRSAMTLMSARMLSSIPVEMQENISFYNFPQSERFGLWTIGGDSTSLVLNMQSPNSREAEQLRDYLVSNESCLYLMEETQQYFYPRGPRNSQIFVPSWERLANDPVMRDYSRQLAAHVSGQID